MHRLIPALTLTLCLAWPNLARAARPASRLCELQPLTTADKDPSSRRADLKPAIAAYAKHRHADACKAVSGLVEDTLAEAERLFRGKDRDKADTMAIERFLDRHVRGGAPLLVVQGDQFIPAPYVRALGADACCRAADGPRGVALLAEAAGLLREARLVAAYALLVGVVDSGASKGSDRGTDGKAALAILPEVDSVFATAAARAALAFTFGHTALVEPALATARALADPVRDKATLAILLGLCAKSADPR